MKRIQRNTKYCKQQQTTEEEEEVGGEEERKEMNRCHCIGPNTEVAILSVATSVTSTVVSNPRASSLHHRQIETSL